MSLPFDLRTFYKITEIWQGGYSLKCCSFCYGLVYLVGKKFCNFILSLHLLLMWDRVVLCALGFKGVFLSDIHRLIDLEALLTLIPSLYVPLEDILYSIHACLLSFNWDRITFMSSFWVFNE